MTHPLAPRRRGQARAPTKLPKPPKAMTRANLSPRKREVYTHIGAARANKEIAYLMQIQLRTLHVYITHIKKGLNVTRYELIRDAAIAKTRDELAARLRVLRKIRTDRLAIERAGIQP